MYNCDASIEMMRWNDESKWTTRLEPKKEEREGKEGKNGDLGKRE
jgi:hypothetical protein